MNTRAIIALTAVAAVAGAGAYLGWGQPDTQEQNPVSTSKNIVGLANDTGADSRPDQNFAEPLAVSEIQPPGCTIVTHYLPNGDGTVTEVFSCKPEKPKEKHPYESYSNAALESLAYSDARAAGVLSMRLRYKDEEAAMSLGATRWRSFFLIELPIIKPGIIVGATFAFAISIGELGATYMLYRPHLTTMPISIYRFLSASHLTSAFKESSKFIANILQHW